MCHMHRRMRPSGCLSLAMPLRIPLVSVWRDIMHEYLNRLAHSAAISRPRRPNMHSVMFANPVYRKHHHHRMSSSTVSRQSPPQLLCILQLRTTSSADDMGSNTNNIDRVVPTWRSMWRCTECRSDIPADADAVIDDTACISCGYNVATISERTVLRRMRLGSPSHIEEVACSAKHLQRHGADMIFAIGHHRT